MTQPGQRIRPTEGRNYIVDSKPADPNLLQQYRGTARPGQQAPANPNLIQQYQGAQRPGQGPVTPNLTNQYRGTQRPRAGPAIEGVSYAIQYKQADPALLQQYRGTTRPGQGPADPTLINQYRGTARPGQGPADPTLINQYRGTQIPGTEPAEQPENEENEENEERDDNPASEPTKRGYVMVISKRAIKRFTLYRYVKSHPFSMYNKMSLRPADGHSVIFTVPLDNQHRYNYVRCELKNKWSGIFKGGLTGGAVGFGSIELLAKAGLLTTVTPGVVENGAVAAAVAASALGVSAPILAIGCTGIVGACIGLGALAFKFFGGKTDIRLPRMPEPEEVLEIRVN